MRFASFALVALCALPACAPYGYGYSGVYGGPVYGSPGYAAPYYPPAYGYAPGYAAPEAAGVVVLDRNERRDDRGGDYRRVDDRDQRRRQNSPQRQQRPAAPQRPAPQQRPGNPQPNSQHAPDFNPADPGNSR